MRAGSKEVSRDVRSRALSNYQTMRIPAGLLPCRSLNRHPWQECGELQKNGRSPATSLKDCCDKRFLKTRTDLRHES